MSPPPFPGQWTDTPGSAAGAPILARWRNWPPSRASPRRWGRPCRPCSGRHPREVQRAFGRFSGGDRFSALAREFFSRLTNVASTIISAASSTITSVPGARFRDDRARSEFDGALDQHCREASRIVEAFAGGWYGKNVYQGDGLTPDSIRKFAPVAFRKIWAELRKRRDADK